MSNCRWMSCNSKQKIKIKIQMNVFFVKKIKQWIYCKKGKDQTINIGKWMYCENTNLNIFSIDDLCSSKNPV